MNAIVFVGVTTGSSLIHKAFPHWKTILGVDCELRGLDIPIDAKTAVYSDALDRLAGDPTVLGAVITSHKLRIFEAGRNRFEQLDPTSVACQEVNAIRRRADGALLGWARDPVSVGRVVDRIWPTSEGQVVCLGAGGTALALAYHLAATRAPDSFICADPSQAAIRRLARATQVPVVSHVGVGPWDELIAEAPAGSLIVNATGLGKDRPGSPTTEHVRFPLRATAWELNYRGRLTFLELAKGQQASRQLRVHDGWDLFCHGWAAALTSVLDLPDDPELGARFADAAHSLRPE